MLTRARSEDGAWSNSTGKISWVRGGLEESDSTSLQKKKKGKRAKKAGMSRTFPRSKKKVLRKWGGLACAV